MYLHRLSVSAKEIRMGSGKNTNVSKKPATLKVDVAQNLFLQSPPQDVSQVQVSHIPFCARVVHAQ